MHGGNERDRAAVRTASIMTTADASPSSTSRGQSNNRRRLTIQEPPRLVRTQQREVKSTQNAPMTFHLGEEAVGGLSAGIVGTLLGFPLDLVKTR